MAPKPEEPKTETTLTTRIRINIPGSRPIPPVVMRTSVADDPTQTGGGNGAGAGSGKGGERTGAHPRPGAPAAAAPPVPPGPRTEPDPLRPGAPSGAPGAPGQGSGQNPGKGPGQPSGQKEKTSDWFAPRKPAASSGASGSSTTGATPRPAAAAETTQEFQAPGIGGRSDLPFSADGPPARTDTPAAGSPRVQPPSGFPGTPPARPAGTAPGAGPAFGSGPEAGRGSGSGAGSGFSAGRDSGGAGAGSGPGFGSGSDTGAGPGSGVPGTGTGPGFGAGAGSGGPGADFGSGAPGTGPAFGSGAGSGGPGAGFGAGAGAGAGSASPFGSGPDTAFGSRPQGGAADAGTAPGSGPGGPGGAPSRGDDTARLTPQAPFGQDGKPSFDAQAKAPGAASASADRTSSDTLVSGIPVVPPSEARAKPLFPAAAMADGQVSGTPGQSGPGQGGGAVDSGAPRVAVPAPKPGAAAPAPAAAKAAPKKAKKKGRSKIVLLGGGLVALVGIAYGAGLLLDHSDVPAGTTVLGVDIGGTTKEAAVQKLDKALGNRKTAPLKVSIGGKQSELKPSIAGLTVDTQATVRGLAGREYNPVTVIGSLFGGARKAEPTIVADDEKMTSALDTLAGGTAGAKDGTIKFEPGKAVPVYGKAHQGLDTKKAIGAVTDAYRRRAETGQDKVTALPSTSRQPAVSNAEVDRLMKDFAKPAMSGLVHVQTDPAHSIPFSPALSLPKILSVKVVNGQLVQSYNLPVLKELYGTTFQGVLIQRGNGSKTPVTPQDVAVALGKALVGKTPAERIGVIPVNGT